MPHQNWPACSSSTSVQRCRRPPISRRRCRRGKREAVVIFHPLERTRNGNDPRAETRSAPESVGLSADENLPPIPGSSQGGLLRAHDKGLAAVRDRHVHDRCRRTTRASPPLPVKVAGRTRRSTRSLSSAAAIGTFEPNRMEGGKRTPDGDPISNYFPRDRDPARFRSGATQSAGTKDEARTRQEGQRWARG